MLKLTFVLLSIFTSLFAQEATEAQMSDIYSEALMFVAIFGSMGVISYIVSKRHAKEYHKETAPQRELKKSMRQKRLEELYELYEKKTLTLQEFQILEEHL